MELEVQNTQLQNYLHAIDWHNKPFTENQLRAILGAACMRYLGGLTEIEFVLELSEAIRKKQNPALTDQFQEATETLHDLVQNVQKEDRHSNAVKPIMNIIIQHIQKALTGLTVVIN